MRIYVTYALNFDRLFAYDNATVDAHSYTYRTPSMICTQHGATEGVAWHADKLSAARRLMFNRKTEIERLEAAGARLKALPDAVEQALAEVISEARVA